MLTYLSGLAIAGLGIIIYRLAFHPLSSFPGPKLAAASGLFFFYYDVIQDGKFHLKLEKLHEEYGSIVRIGPNELHIRHPDAYDQVYRVGSKASKWSWYYSCFGVSQSTFGSVNNADHTQRRAAISSFFSRQSVLALEDILSRPIEKLCAHLTRLYEYGQESEARCPMEQAYRCISLDSVSEIAFGRSFNYLDKHDFGQAILEGFEDSLRTICVIRHFPPLVPVFNNMPLWIMRMAGEKLAAVRMLKEFARDATRSTFLESAREKEAKALWTSASEPTPLARTILQEMVNNPDPRKTGAVTRRRLEEEALSLIAASADTVGNALTMATYQLLRHPEAHARLVEELRQAIPEGLQGASFKYDSLANLPWLSAVIKEALRMSYGLVGRLPRLVPDGGLEVLGQHIPAGSIVSMSTYLQHNDPAVFPNPHAFQPERWLEQDDEDDEGNSSSNSLNRYLVAFGKGRHNCVGATMAYALLYKTLAAVHRRFDLRIEGGITDEDLEYEDHFVGLHRRDAIPLMVSVLSTRP